MCPRAWGFVLMGTLQGLILSRAVTRTWLPAALASAQLSAEPAAESEPRCWVCPVPSVPLSRPVPCSKSLPCLSCKPLCPWGTRQRLKHVHGASLDTEEFLSGRLFIYF